ncbi:MAG: hypothetical protein JNJ54_23705 [Myxococcaceae bacterium]|nr:hypothetical protein [Myxococcaceae bacterium]
MLALIALLVLAADPTSCAADADCVLISGCECSCCPRPLKAVTKPEAEAVRRRCATLGDCGDVCRAGELAKCQAPEDPAAVKAVCRGGRCVKEPAKAECTTDDDCAMAHDCGCECCPSPWVALPRDRAARLKQKCARLGPCRPPDDQCREVKCPALTERTASCREGRCEAVPRKR